MSKEKGNEDKKTSTTTQPATAKTTTKKEEQKITRCECIYLFAYRTDCS